jgi:colicin import membrane protein
MSAELLVMLAFLTLLPIIEQALRKMRERREEAERRAKGLPPLQPAPPAQQRPPQRQPQPRSQPQPQAQPQAQPQPPPLPPWTEPWQPEQRTPHAPLPPEREWMGEIEEVIVLRPEARSKPPRRRRPAKEARVQRPYSLASDRPRASHVADARAITREQRASPASVARSFLQDPALARKGIILMELLGPCRAVSPHEAPSASRTQREA